MPCFLLVEPQACWDEPPTMSGPCTAGLTPTSVHGPFLEIRFLWVVSGCCFQSAGAWGRVSWLPWG